MIDDSWQQSQKKKLHSLKAGNEEKDNEME